MFGTAVTNHKITHMKEETINMITDLLIGQDAFVQLKEEWDTLASQGMTDTPFQTLAYQKAWWTHLHPPNSELYTITVRDTDNTLLAIGAFYIYEGTLYFNGCVEETDYLDLICKQADAERCWTAVFDCLTSDQFPDWQHISLCNVPEKSPTRTILPQLAAQKGFTTTESIHEVCPVITLPATFDDYLQAIDSKQRREIQRKLRRAAGAEAELIIVQPDDDLTDAVDTFLDLLQKSTFEKRDWLNDGRRAVFHDTAQAAMADGTLQLMFMAVNGRKAAALFNFHYKNRIWVYNSGLDPEAFGALSLGVVLTAKAIETAIQLGCHEFDFLRGNETYKYRFGAVDTNIYKIEIGR
ncbi:MAG: GNAT family N-acetyltransferase [Candidatus Thermofonsia bacterium]|nr:MAG: GNAT family N-acetyltransferase [Candidatus Thermofonsia bacterium]